LLIFWRFGNLYSEENVAISGTHTHGGPGGYLQYLVYSVTSLGFVKQSFDVIADAIEESIIQAHNNLKPGSVYMNIGNTLIMAASYCTSIILTTISINFIFL